MRESLSGASQHLLNELTSLDATVSGMLAGWQAIPVVLRRRLPAMAGRRSRGGVSAVHHGATRRGRQGLRTGRRAVRSGSGESWQWLSRSAWIPRLWADALERMQSFQKLSRALLEEIDRTVKDLHQLARRSRGRARPGAREVDARYRADGPRGQRAASNGHGRTPTTRRRPRPIGRCGPSAVRSWLR